MRSLLPALLIALLGCSEVEAPPVAVTRQGVLQFLDGGLRAKGITPQAHLGASIVTCPTAGWVAGATGDDSMYVSPLRARMRSARPYFSPIDPLPLACLGSSASLRVLMGGPNNTWAVFPDAGSLSVYSQRADSFDVSAGYLALGDTLFGTIRIYSNATTGTALSNAFTTSNIANMGNSVSWSERGELLVGNVSMRTAIIFYPSATMDAGQLGPFFTFTNPEPGVTGTDFGRVVLIGDVSPEMGEEYLIAAPAIGRVYVYSGAGLVGTLRGGPSFGAALALEPDDIGGIHALWIGEPAADQVHRYVAGQGTTFSAPPQAADSGFGTSIALDKRGGLVAIGAPRFSEGTSLEVGAVFEAFFDAGMASTPCIAGSCVLPGCMAGTCVTSLLCLTEIPARSLCGAGQVCSNEVCITPFDAGLPDAGLPLDAGMPIEDDAGIPDAGLPDAGTPDAGVDAGLPDAGAPDAGQPDAGEPDAGERDAGVDAGMDAGIDAGTPDAGVEEVQVFNTCGCTTADLPLLLVALAFFARRRVTATK
jgi:hypothetical protein